MSVKMIIANAVMAGTVNEIAAQQIEAEINAMQAENAKLRLLLQEWLDDYDNGCFMVITNKNVYQNINENKNYNDRAVYSTTYRTRAALEVGK